MTFLEIAVSEKEITHISNVEKNMFCWCVCGGKVVEEGGGEGVERAVRALAVAVFEDGHVLVAVRANWNLKGRARRAVEEHRHR